MGELPEFLIIGYLAAIGACLGSFIGVVVDRLPAQKSIVRPGSHCQACLRPIAWYDNIPILSFLILQGRCRFCKNKIPVRALILEVLMAALVVAIWLRFGLSWELALWLPISTALIAITFLDLDHFWIPDVLTYPMMLLALLAAFLPGRISIVAALLGLIPAALALLVAFGFARITGREGLGLGDIKLLAALGLAVGLEAGLTILILGAFQGAVLGGLALILGGHKFLGAPNEVHKENHQMQKPGSYAFNPLNVSGERSAVSYQRSAISGQPSDISNQRSADSCLLKAESPITETVPDSDPWVPPPRAIPFGPFLVLATFEILLLPNVFSDLITKIFGIELK